MRYALNSSKIKKLFWSSKLSLLLGLDKTFKYFHNQDYLNFLKKILRRLGNK